MRDAERGFVLTAVLVTFLVIEVMVIGVLAVVMSDLHGAVGHQLAMQSVHVAEAGLNYGVAQLVTRASMPLATDDRYAGEPDEIALAGSDGRAAGTFRVTVRCAHPPEAIPPDCHDGPATAELDERDFRIITSFGVVGRPGRARRQIEAVVRRYTPGPGGAPGYGVCGREGVELGPGTTITADVGSNGDVYIDGPRRNPGTVRERLPRGPQIVPVVQAVSPESLEAGLNGVYSWRVTFVDARDHESGGSPPTRPVVLNEQVGYLTHIPLGDPSTVARRIYRSPNGSPRGPWFMVGEIPDNLTQEFTDNRPEGAFSRRIPGGISGSVTAGGTVSCTRGCAQQVDGPVRAQTREVVCPNFLPPPAQPVREPAQAPIIQAEVKETVHWGALRVREGGTFTIQTLSVRGAELHIHLAEIHLERDATLAITGLATVYFHVEGGFVLGPRAAFGTVDFFGHLVSPSDRVQVLIGARDPSLIDTGRASVRLEGENSVSALLFAPNANIVADRVVAFSGGLYGKYVRLNRSSGIVLDPVEGLSSERVGVRPSPYQYVMRWYDNPTPSP
ncbi:MAG: hypothetical protein ACT4PY_08365 [Armatimonadota bacterium]